MPFVAVLGTPYEEQRTPSHGDFLRIWPLFSILVRRIDNECVISFFMVEFELS
jgi:hypothetical protein